METYILIKHIDYIDLLGCKAEMFKGLDWPETAKGETASVNCPCPGSQDSMAFRQCKGSFTAGAVWNNETDTDKCLAQKAHTVSERLCQAMLVSIEINLLYVHKAPIYFGSIVSHNGILN